MLISYFSNVAAAAFLSVYLLYLFRFFHEPDNKTSLFFGLTMTFGFSLFDLSARTWIPVYAYLKPFASLLIIALMFTLFFRERFRTSILIALLSIVLMGVAEALATLVVMLSGIPIRELINPERHLLSVTYNLSVYLIGSLVFTLAVSVRHQFTKNMSTRPLFRLTLIMFMLTVSSFFLLSYFAQRDESIEIAFNYVLVFIFFFSLFYVYNLRVTDHMRAKEQELAQQQFYNHALEPVVDNLRRLKHGFDNNLAVISGMAHMGKGDEIVRYIASLTEENARLFEQIYFPDIRNMALHGALSALVSKARSQNVRLDVITSGDIEEITTMPVPALCEIIGILGDNAIESAAHSEHRRMLVEIHAEASDCILIIRNTYRDLIPIPDMFSKGKSSKGEDRGHGLWYVQQLLNRFPDASLDTFTEHDYLVQELTLLKNKKTA